jgi:abequosyltransferase
MNIDQNILLTIAVPTYNRASYLARTLTSIFSQVGKYGDAIEIIVSDNCSTDHTAALVEEFQRAGHRFRFLGNPENLGADGNFKNCYHAARGKYFWLFSDDDVLLEGALDRVFPLLQEGDYGVLSLGVYFFNEDPLAERPRRRPGKLVVHSDTRSFLKAVNIWFTFISSTIVNRKACGAVLLEDFDGTCLLQLGWVLPALLNARRNVQLTEYLVAAQFENSGGYRFCEVFGRNLNQVFRVLSERHGYDARLFEVINRITLKRHLSKYILAARKDFGSFGQEDFLEVLHPVFKSYASYWTFIYPSITWPLPLAKLWCKVCRRIAKMTGTL